MRASIAAPNHGASDAGRAIRHAVRFLALFCWSLPAEASQLQKYDEFIELYIAPVSVPAIGLSASLYTYIASDATTADAWTKAFSLMPPEDIAGVFKAPCDLTVYLRRRDGKRLTLSA